MKTCSNCNHMQEQGMFCAKCGKELVTQDTAQQQQVNSQEQNQQAVNHQGQNQQTVTPQEPNQQVEKLKQISNGYVGTFTSLLKNPTQRIQDNNNLVNSVISFVLLTFLTALTVYMMAKGVFDEYVGSYYSFLSDYSGKSASLPINVLFTLFIVIALFAIIAITAVFLMAKIFIGQASFKQVFVQVTNYYPAIIVLIVVGFLLQLIDMNGLALIVVIVTLILTVLLIPLYEIVQLLQGTTIKIDYFYVYLILAALISILVYIVTKTIVSEYLEDVMDSFSDIF